MRLTLCVGMRDKVNQMNIRSYSELMQLPTFEERYEYLRLDGQVGAETFGFDRYLNQRLYKDQDWLDARDYVIIRDNGCDLGALDRPIPEDVKILVHHINPITKEDILNRDPKLFDPENLISTIKITHDAIHYGNEDLLYKDPIERRRNDTCPWRT